MSDLFLADDLSGALDAGAAFFAAGRPVTIALSLAAPVARGQPDELIGFTTETRNASPDDAAAVVAQAIARGRRDGSRLRYKKIDSTLRGPVAAELAALAAALPEARILFSPANPAVGRTVRDGVLRVHGVPVAETEFARDPVSPVRVSEIRRLLGAAATPRVTIADAENDADLRRAVERFAAGAGEWVAVGSGALARAVAAVARQADSADAPPAAALPREAAGPVLFVCGSAHPANRIQAERLAQASGVVLCEIDPGAPGQSGHAAAAALRERNAAALRLAPRAADSLDSRRALAALVEAARIAIADTGVRRLMITGGETAFALCAALGIEVLNVRGEIEPGLVLAEARSPCGPSWWFAIKPGGFGGAETWLHAYAALRGHESRFVRFDPRA